MVRRSCHGPAKDAKMKSEMGAPIKLLTETMLAQPRKLVPSAWNGHIPFAVWFVSAIKPRVLVELGTHAGGSYLAFCQSVFENGLDTRCYAVDTWQGDEHAGFYGEEVFRELAEYHDRNYGAFSRLLKMTFDEAAASFSDKSVDLLHIDGLHTYEAVRHDFETWRPKLSERGVVLFHDINVRERGFGVWQLWEELRESYPTFEFEHAHGLGVLFVSKEAPAEIRALVSAGRTDISGTTVKRLFAMLGERICQQFELGELKRILDVRDSQIAAIGQSLAERDRQVAAVTQVVAERDGQVANLIQTVANRDSALVERDGRIGSLSQTVAERDSQIAALNQAVGERDAQVAGLNQAVTDRNGQITSLSQAITAMQTSTSWKITRPLRYVGHIIRRLAGAP